MALKMTSREVDCAAVLALHGRIVLGDGHRALCDKLKNLMSEGKKKIVLNLDHIEHIDGFGLGVLIAAHLSAKTQGASPLWAEFCPPCWWMRRGHPKATRPKRVVRKRRTDDRRPSRMAGADRPVVVGAAVVTSGPPGRGRCGLRQR